MPIKFSATLTQGRLTTGPHRLPSMLLELQGIVGNLRPFWVGEFLPRYQEEIAQNFETEGEFSGVVSGWPELSPQYAAWKSRHFPTAKILERTRRLRNSLTPGAGAFDSGNSRDTVMQAGPTSLRFGTRVRYARYHTEKRPFMPRVRAKQWHPIILDWLKKRAQEKGFELASNLRFAR